VVDSMISSFGMKTDIPGTQFVKSELRKTFKRKVWNLNK